MHKNVRPFYEHHVVAIGGHDELEDWGQELDEKDDGDVGNDVSVLRLLEGRLCLRVVWNF